MSFLYLNLTGSVSCDSLGLAPIIPFNSSSLFFACAFLGGRRLKNVLDVKLLESPPIHLKLLPHVSLLSGVCSRLAPYFVRKFFILSFKSFLRRITLVTNNTCTNCGTIIHRTTPESPLSFGCLVPLCPSGRAPNR